ncbi:MAG: hypothetical protein M1825_003825 [Sarcosagium campestre]|nr:MAG: hypothetical protein M1825_003825 [Sarcosagium campestre]
MSDMKPPVAKVPEAAAPLPKGNPALRMMGLPNFKLKLPSRNWLIFLSVTGSITSMILYDKYQKKKAQEKWCKLVSHVSREPFDTKALPRKVTVFLAAPPGDGLRAPREYFLDYIKPILVAGAIEWDVVEGRREGEVRAGLAERIRKLRKRLEAERSGKEPGEDDVVRGIQFRGGIREFDGMKGDIVIGRHTWKEYIRGLHEGWLGPLLPPEILEPDTTSDTLIDTNDSQTQTLGTTSSNPSSLESPTSVSPPAAPPAEKIKTAAEGPPPAYLPTSAYSEASLPTTIPTAFDPSSPFRFQHLLGFLNTPIRIYRFFNRRKLADEAGREAAAVVLALETRPYGYTEHSDTFQENRSHDEESNSSRPKEDAEQQTVLVNEETDWHKSVRQTKDGDDERVWLDGIVLDDRIAKRMLRFVLTEEEQRRAERISLGLEGAKDDARDVGEDSIC